MRFLVINKNNNIVGDYCGDPAAVKIKEDEFIKEVSFDFNGVIGENLIQFEGERRKTIEELVSEGIITLSEDEEIKDGQIVNKPEPEKPFSLSEYKALICLMLSDSCYAHAERILPMKKQLNVLFGANSHYPAYLQGETGQKNIKDFINIFQQIYHSNAVLIQAAEKREDVDNIFNNITFPKEEDILKNLVVI